jgi:predicted nucleotidyltransferase
MKVDTRLDLAQEVIATLRARAAELCAVGIRGLSLFGSVARGDFGAESDADRAVEERVCEAVYRMGD